MLRLDRATQPKVPQFERLEVRGAEQVGGLDVAVHEGRFADVEEAEGGAELRTPARDEVESDKRAPAPPPL